jgi:hypothetical protein
LQTGLTSPIARQQSVIRTFLGGGQSMNQEDQITIIPFPAGVADPDGQRAYVAAGGIEAIELSTGLQLWRADLPGRPVAVTERRLIVLCSTPEAENELHLLTLDKDKGDATKPLAAAVFPRWVVASIVPDESFSYQITIDGVQLCFAWEAHARYRGGAPPSDQVLAQETNDAQGVIRINVATGETKALDDAAQKEIELPEILNQTIIFSYQRGASATWHSEPWSFDHRLAVISGEVSDDRQTLKLVRWAASGNDIDEPVSLVSGQNLVSYVTPDGLFIFIHSEAPGSGDIQPWHLFSARSGEQIAVLNYEDGTKEPCVLGSSLYHLVEDPPPAARISAQTLQVTMKALDLVSGRLLWERLLLRQSTRSRPTLRP